MEQANNGKVSKNNERKQLISSSVFEERLIKMLESENGTEKFNQYLARLEKAMIWSDATDEEINARLEQAKRERPNKSMMCLMLDKLSVEELKENAILMAERYDLLAAKLDELEKEAELAEAVFQSHKKQIQSLEQKLATYYSISESVRIIFVSKFLAFGSVVKKGSFHNTVPFEIIAIDFCFIVLTLLVIYGGCSQATTTSVIVFLPLQQSAGGRLTHFAFQLSRCIIFIKFLCREHSLVGKCMFLRFMPFLIE